MLAYVLWTRDLPFSKNYIVAETFIQEDFLLASLRKQYFFGKDIEEYRVSRHPVCCVPSHADDVSEFDSENWGTIVVRGPNREEKTVVVVWGGIT